MKSMSCNGSLSCTLFTGIALIGVRLEVEYNRINLGGSTEYLGWIKGTIAAWNRSKGYLVNFEDGRPGMAAVCRRAGRATV